MFRKNTPKIQGKIIDIESGMEGDFKFTTPVNLKINSKFEGTLDTKGILIIGDNAEIKTKLIKGEDITISGKVVGDIISSKRLALLPPAKVVGNINAPLLIVNEGAMLKGDCKMPIAVEKDETKKAAAPKSKRKKK